MENKKIEGVYPLSVFYALMDEKIAHRFNSLSVKRNRVNKIRDVFIPQRKKGTKGSLLTKLFLLNLRMPFEQRQEYIENEMAKEGYTPAIYDELFAFVTSDNYPEGERIYAGGSFYNFPGTGRDQMVYYSKDHIFEFEQLGGSNLLFLGVRAR